MTENERIWPVATQVTGACVCHEDSMARRLLTEIVRLDAIANESGHWDDFRATADAIEWARKMLGMGKEESR